MKSKILELMYSWTLGLPHEVKILEAYQMLKKQGESPARAPGWAGGIAGGLNGVEELSPPGDGALERVGAERIRVVWQHEWIWSWI